MYQSFARYFLHGYRMKLQFVKQVQPPSHVLLVDYLRIGSGTFVGISFFDSYLSLQFLFIYHRSTYQHRYFRSSLDHWSTMFGMVFALNMPIYKRWIKVSEWMSPELQFSVKILPGIVLAIISAAWFVGVYSLPKLDYNEHHAYFGWIPIIFYLFVRNSTQYLRNKHLELLARMGKITLETYLLQHHVWLTSNAKTLLTIVPHSKAVNLILVGLIYMYISNRLYRLTMRLRGMILPDKDLQKCMIGLCVVGSIVLGGILEACHVHLSHAQGLQCGHDRQSSPSFR